MKAIQLITLTVLYILAASVQGFKFGKCPSPPVQQNFDLSKFLGKWYGIQRLSDIQMGECSTTVFSLQSPGVAQIVHRELLADGSNNTIFGTAKPTDPSEPAKLEASIFENLPPAPYWVLSTDYDSYSLVYSCVGLAGVFSMELAWIMSREPTLPEGIAMQLLNILRSIGVSVDDMSVTNQDEVDCQRLWRC